MDIERPLDQIPRKNEQNIRLVTFNINGYRTVFHYHPWNKLRNFTNMFNSLHGDIVTLQEMKVAAKDVNNSVGRIDGYNCFLSIPSLKKGYSGVAVYVRIPNDDDPECVKTALKVVKAEEGITGVLVSHDTQEEYYKSSKSIGGYPNLDEEISQRIDNEGRCVVLETANNTVILSVYCPANSMGTEEGDHFRVQFFEALFTRIRNLEELGKHVVLMGDINIARDLIDSADGIHDRLKMGRLLKVIDKFEDLNRQESLNFIRRSIPRILLNELLLDSIDQEFDSGKSRVMIDLVRKIQGRKQGLYTVWNTLKNSRPGNYGSRIDLILATEELSKTCGNANIWPYLMGSDHCPVFSDFDVSQSKPISPLNQPLPRLEARFVYKLSAGIIDSMFGNSAKKRSASPVPIVIPPSKRPKGLEPHRKYPPKKQVAKGQNIMSFFKPSKPPSVATQNDDTSDVEVIKTSQSSQSSQPKKSSSLSIGSNGQFSFSSETVPECKHKEPCILKTAMTKENKGKKFWTCARTKGHSETKEEEEQFTCGYFQWK